MHPDPTLIHSVYASAIPDDSVSAAPTLADPDTGNEAVNPANTVPTNAIPVDPKPGDVPGDPTLSKPIRAVSVPVEPIPEPTALVDPILCATATLINGMHFAYPIPTDPDPVVHVNPTQ